MNEEKYTSHNMPHDNSHDSEQNSSYVAYSKYYVKANTPNSFILAYPESSNNGYNVYRKSFA